MYFWSYTKNAQKNVLNRTVVLLQFAFENDSYKS